MRRKKVEVRSNEHGLIKISEENGRCYFEIGKEITNDLGEAVAMMMRLKSKWNDQVWDLNIIDSDYVNIDVSKSLYWLSGGDEEWLKGDNYQKEWNECESEFAEKFGKHVIKSLKDAKKLKDIRSGFLKYLNLSILYNFALERKIA